MKFCNNPKAKYDYFIEDTIEAGLVLLGTEIKSVRLGAVSINEAYIAIRNQEVYLINSYIAPYEKGNIFNKDPQRERKLLLHKKEISKLKEQVEEKGITLIPLDIHTSNQKAKLLLGVCRGKKNYDKRQSIKERDISREISRNSF